MRQRETLSPPAAKVLERGTLGDRPWGVTLAAFAAQARSGQLSVRGADGKVLSIALAHGLVVGAASPLAVDAVARIAVSDHLVTPGLIAELERVRRTIRRDELEPFLEAAGLEGEQVRRLERRVLVQRAARTFAIERGTFELVDKITIPVLLGVQADLRAVIYQGARLNLDATRLANDLRGFGARFALVADREADLERFELTEAEAPIVEALRAGTSLPELEARRRDLDPRMAQAVLYALAACGAIAPIAARAASEPARLPPAPPPPDDLAVPSEPDRRASAELALPRTPTPREPALSSVPMIIRSDPTITRVPTPRQPTASRAPTPHEPTTSRVPTLHEPTASRVPTAHEPMTSRVPTPPAPAVSRVPTAEEPVTSRVPVARPPAGPPPIPARARGRSAPPPIPGRSPTVPPPIPGRTAAPTAPPPQTARPRTDRAPSILRPPRFPTEPFLEARATVMRPNALTAREVRALIASRSALLEQGVDHFTLLGVPIGASVEAVRAAYLELARNLRPDRLAELGIADDGFGARTLFAQICIAQAVLSEPERRAAYIARLRDSGAPQVAEVDFGKLAADAFRRGERALRGDDPELAIAELRTACELVPDEIEYLATLGRAEFQASKARARPSR